MLKLLILLATKTSSACFLLRENANQLKSSSVTIGTANNSEQSAIGRTLERCKLQRGFAFQHSDFKSDYYLIFLNRVVTAVLILSTLSDCGIFCYCISFTVFACVGLIFFELLDLSMKRRSGLTLGMNSETKAIAETVASIGELYKRG